MKAKTETPAPVAKNGLRTLLGWQAEALAARSRFASNSVTVCIDRKIAPGVNLELRVLGDDVTYRVNGEPKTEDDVVALLDGGA